MTAAGSTTDDDGRSAEERAEELMQRFTGEASRMIARVVGRAREELEDLVAEARALNERRGTEESSTSPRSAEQ
jgi:hypothetical protein